MADTIILMNHGEIQQMAAPEVIYNDPNNVFTAQFIGTPPMNIHRLSDGATQIGYRPEKIQLSREKGNWLYCRKAKIITREMLGSETLYKLLLQGEDKITVMAKSLDMDYAVDEEIFVGVDQADLYYFDAEGMRIRDESILTGCYELTKEDIHD